MKTKKQSGIEILPIDPFNRTMQITKYLSEFASKRSKSDSKEYLIEYCINNQNKAAVRILKNYNDTSFIATYGFVAKMITDGYDDDEMIKRVENYLKKIVGEYKEQDIIKKEVENEFKPAKIVKEYDIDSFFEHIDKLLDNYFIDGVVFDIYKEFEIFKVPKKYFSEVKLFCDGIISDIEQNMNEHDNQYSNMSVPRLKKLLHILEIDSKNVRKPRSTRKKKIDPAKAIAKVKYRKEDLELEITSENPIRLPESKFVVLFNVRYKTLILLKSKTISGMMVRGTSIVDYNDKILGKKIVKNPKVVLKELMDFRLQTEFISFFDNMPSKCQKHSSRLDENVIILKIIN
jgi:hypothetical protein